MPKNLSDDIYQTEILNYGLDGLVKSPNSAMELDLQCKANGRGWEGKGEEEDSFLHSETGWNNPEKGRTATLFP